MRDEVCADTGRSVNKRFMRGGLIAVGWLLLAGMAASAQAAPGDLDPRFGSGGRLRATFGGIAGVNALARQADGRLIAAGTNRRDYREGGGAYTVALLGFRPDGSPDRSFGDTGQVEVPGPGGGITANDVISQPDGKLVTVGADFLSPVGDRAFLLMRFNRDGSIDQTFGSSGRVVTDFGQPRADGLALIRQPDGKLVAAGMAGDQNSTAFALARYNADGSLDTSFAAGGRLVTRFRLDRATATALVRQPDGKLVVSGSDVDDRGRLGERGDFALARYNADGSLDGSFGVDGKVITAIGDSRGNALVLQRDGKLVAGGISFRGSTERSSFTLVRYHRDGSVDRGFGAEGVVLDDFPEGAPVGPRLHALSLQRDGSIIAAGEEAGADGFAIARYRPDGSLDRRFGFGGRVATSFTPTNPRASVSSANAALLEPSGKLTLGGSFRSTTSPSNPGDFAIARYYATVIGSLGRIRAQQDLRLVIRRGVSVPLRCSEPCRVTVTLRLDGAAARRARLPTTIGRTDVRFTRGASGRAVVRLSPIARARVARLRTVRVAMRARFTGAPRRPDFESRRLTLR